jgi:calcium-dependent protein kinase
MGCSGSKAAANDADEKIKGKTMESSAPNTERGGTNFAVQGNGEIKIESHMLVGENKEQISKTYKILEKLGEGTFGKVYKTLHIPSNQYRAMKLVRKENVKFQDDDRLFLKEIEVLSKLDHPSIIKVYEYFIDKKFYYVVTELALGGELYDQIAKIQYYNESDAACIMQQLFSGVYYLHSNNIMHRDLKPENMMLETNVKGDLTIKLIDFGAANFYSSDEKEGKLTLKVGTPYYIAPEVIKKNYDNKCDLWSCGVIMYILLCGYPPFDGDDDQDIMNNVVKCEYTFDSQEWMGVSTDAKNMIKKLLIKDPKKRINAEQALKEPWIVKNLKMRGSKEFKELPKLCGVTLQKFTSKQKLQQASIAFLIHQMSTNEKVKSLRAIFKQLDESGDGRLSHQELKNGYTQFFSDSLTEHEFDNLIAKLDQDNSGYIEYEEFLRATIDTETILTEKNLEFAFNFFDKDASGKLSAEEVKSVLGVINSEKDGGDIVKNIIAEVDTNGDGEINFEEFKNLMKKNAQ